MKITSKAFEHNAHIPKDHTGEGRDVSPQLHFSGIPAEAKTLALICDDPDAPRPEPGVHWVIYNIPADTTELPEGLAKTRDLHGLGNAKQGVNDFGPDHFGYNGPLPPKGHGVHHYHFTLYALPDEIHPAGKASKHDVIKAMGDRIIGKTTLTGLYERK
eukprot:EC722013.1.p1 GENE.EC722013.1~~EC722013.1.p1  ORF type:complete len:159 (+),score=9.35 EC722013.1:45-521(+)